MEITENMYYYNQAKNPTSIGGGAICINTALVLVSNCTFVGNTAITDGGAVISHYNNVIITIEDSAFTNNHAGDHGGALVTNIYPSDYLSSSLTAYLQTTLQCMMVEQFLWDKEETT